MWRLKVCDESGENYSSNRILIHHITFVSELERFKCDSGGGLKANASGMSSNRSSSLLVGSDESETRIGFEATFSPNWNLPVVGDS